MLYGLSSEISVMGGNNATAILISDTRATCKT